MRAERGVDPRIERSRQVILRAALSELGEAGYGAFTIESVATRAGVAKSTIYRHWSDKINLIADAFESAHEHAAPSVEGLTTREGLQRLLGHVAEVVVDSVFSSCIPALIEGAERDPRLREFRHRYSALRRQSLWPPSSRAVWLRESSVPQWTPSSQRRHFSALSFTSGL